MRLPWLGSPRSTSPNRPGVVLKAGCAIALATSTLAVAGPTQAAAAPASTNQASARPSALTPSQALTSAHKLGKPVAVPGATTSTSTLTANPDGTLTTIQNVAPIRKYVAGVWKDLDATLHTNPDGSISPAVTTSALTLSGGGSGPLATMTTAGRDLAVGAPATLPAPSIDGASATYKGVLSGVDLQVTANPQGGFSEALVVHDAQAAANPALKTIALQVNTSRGLSLTNDDAGNIAALDPAGRPLFTAPAPIMWDSTPSSAPAVKNPRTGQSVDATTGEPVKSSAQSPGEGAKTASLAAQAIGNRVRLTPSRSLLSSSSTVFPVFIDPTWNPDAAGSKRNSWTYVNSNFDTTSYWKTSDPLRVGDNAWDSPFFVARSFLNVSIPSAIYGATVISSTMSILEDWSPSCTAEPVQLWRTGGISSSTNWSNQPSWISQIDSVTAAHGYSSSCPSANVGFDTTDIMKSAASSKWNQLTVGLRAGDEGDKYGWKKFSNTIASFSTTYDHVPSTPTTLTTSPATTCTATLTTVGDGAVSLYAKVSDPDSDHVGASFTVTKASTGAVLATSSNTTALSSGTTATYIVPRATLDTAAAGTVTKISWKVQVTDYKYTSAWSKTCSFNFDPTRPGSPTISDPGSETIGSASTFMITPPPTGTAPTSYLYQLNGSAPVAVAVVSGQPTQFTLTPPRYTNTLTVTALSAGGNVGDSAALTFNATAAATAADGDLSGDGIPDLLTTGNANGLPSGLWLANGQAGAGHTTGDGQIIATATDIGVNGAAVTTVGAGPADFDTSQAITGHITGSGLQDVLTYFPTGTYAGDAVALNGNGDGSPIQAQDNADAFAFPSGSFTDFNGTNTDNALQIANVGNVSGRNLPYPDLIAVNGDATNGYYLDYYPSLDFPTIYDLPTQLTTTLAPDGTMNWNAWTITTAQTATGTSMFLWNSTSHALYLWANPTYDYGAGTFSPGTQYLVSSTFNPGTGAHLQAADIDGDGTPDLWATTTGPTATAYLVTNLSTTAAATITAQPAQTLLTGKHTWQLNDAASGTLATAADSTGTLNLTGTAGATGNDGDLFSPDAGFNGTTGVLHTASSALATNADFTVSAWVKPTAAKGTVFSEQGTHMSMLSLYIDGTTKKWVVGMAQADANSATIDANAGSAVNLGTWTHVTVSFKASTGSLGLYVNGIESHRTVHTTLANVAGQFHIGNSLTNSVAGSFFTGQIADVQVWSQTLTPTQIAQQSGTPGYVLFESDGSTYSSGTWTTAHGKMTLVRGLLSIIETNNANTTVNFGTTFAGFLTVETNGNAAIYVTASHSIDLWTSNTGGHPNDVMIFQPDGNLVIYDADGTVLWSSGTSN